MQPTLLFAQELVRELFKVWFMSKASQDPSSIHEPIQDYTRLVSFILNKAVRSISKSYPGDVLKVLHYGQETTKELLELKRGLHPYPSRRWLLSLLPEYQHFERRGFPLSILLGAEEIDGEAPMFCSVMLTHQQIQYSAYRNEGLFRNQQKIKLSPLKQEYAILIASKEASTPLPPHTELRNVGSDVAHALFLSEGSCDLAIFKTTALTPYLELLIKTSGAQSRFYKNQIIAGRREILNSYLDFLEGLEND